MNGDTSAPRAAALPATNEGDLLLQAWDERDQFDPDCWFGIPDFDVKPADVGFRGFYSPILYPGNVALTEGLRGFVRIARALARASDIESMRELRQIAVETLQLADSASDHDRDTGVTWGAFSEKQRAAYSYIWCVESLERYASFALGPLRNAEGPGRIPEGLLWLTNYSPANPTPEEAIGQIAYFGQWITSWSHDGAKSALGRHMQRISRAPRLGARKPLRARISALMRGYKIEKVKFKQFLRSWESNRVLDELGLEPNGADATRYSVSDERDPNFPSDEYTVSTLRTMYSESDKDVAG